MTVIPTDSSLLLYQTDDGQTRVEVRLQDETVWLSQAQLCELFDKDKRTISEHIQNIFQEKELAEEAVVRKFRTTASDGKNYQVTYYNLDVIISVGYRVSSHRGTQFRIWATNRLKEYLSKALHWMTTALSGLVEGTISVNFWPGLETSDPPKKYSGGKSSTSMLPASTTTRKRKTQSSFSQSYKTRCTGQLMAIRLPKSSTPGPMPKKHTWDLLLGWQQASSI